jgi:hypothetical protein
MPLFLTPSSFGKVIAIEPVCAISLFVIGLIWFLIRPS